MTFDYTYTATVSQPQLYDEIMAAGITSELLGMRVLTDGTLVIIFSEELTSGDETSLDNVVSSHVITPPEPRSQEITSTTPFSTTSSTGVDIPDVITTPPDGDYYLSFHSVGSVNSSSATVTVSIAVDGTILPSTTKRFVAGVGNTNFTLDTQTFTTLNGSEEVTIVVSTTTGTVTFNERTLCQVDSQ